MVKNYLLHFYIACFCMLSIGLKASNYDIVATSINAPCLFVFTNQTLIPAAFFVNNGNDIVSDILFHASIYNEKKELVYEDEFLLKEFSPNIVKLVQFNKSFQANTTGKFTITVNANVNQDADSSNNSISKEFEIRSEDLSPSSGNALQFDGKSWMDLGSKLPQKNFTVESWVYPIDQSNEGILTAVFANTGENIFTVSLKGISVQVFMKTDNGTAQIESSIKGKLNTWMHLAVTYNGGSLTLYVNGKNAGDVDISGNVIDVYKSIILGRGQADDKYANFAIDNFKLWNKALSINEIRMGMHYKNPAFSNPNLIQYLRFDEEIRSLNYLEDASGNCHAGYFIHKSFLEGDTTYKNFSIISTIPLQNSNGELLYFTNDNRQFTTDSSLSLQFKNFKGNGQVLAFKPQEVAFGMQPESAITSVSKQSFNDNWLIYFYGDYQYENLNAGFTIAGKTKIIPAKLTDLYLTQREIGSDQNWNILQNPANSFDQKNNCIYFNIEPNQSLTAQLGIAANIVNATLPVKFCSFTASKQLNGVQLNWTTASEINNNYYQIERSADGKQYEAIGKIKSAGNSSLNQEYTFTDLQAYSLNTNKLYYRLGQYDIDGTGNNTHIIEVDLDKEDLIFVQSILPNPFCNKLVLGINSSQEINIRIDIINGNGQNLFHKMVNTEKGYQQINLEEAGNLPIGVYYMRIEYNNIVSLQKLFKLSN